jgi:hypothetical protein
MKSQAISQTVTQMRPTMSATWNRIKFTVNIN